MCTYQASRGAFRLSYGRAARYASYQQRKRDPRSLVCLPSHAFNPCPFTPHLPHSPHADTPTPITSSCDPRFHVSISSLLIVPSVSRSHLCVLFYTLYLRHALSTPSSHNPKPHQHHQHHQHQPTNPTRFTTQDDSLLKGGIEKHSSLQTIAEQIKFSCKFDLHDIADRWRTLLYEPDVAAESASKAEAEAYKAKRVPWSAEEEDFIRSETRKDLDFKRILGGALCGRRLCIDVDTKSVVFHQLIGVYRICG